MQPENVMYKDIRDQIKTGDLLIWKKDRMNAISNAFLSIVRFFTRSEFAHVAVAWRVRNRLFIVEATIPQVRIYPVSSFDEFYHISMGLNVEDEQLDYLLGKVGMQYSIIDAVRGYLGMTLERTDRWQCVELANRFYRTLGINYGDIWTPTDFVNNILESGEKAIRLVKKKT